MHALLTCLLVRQHLHAEDGPKWCEALVEEQLVCVEGQVLQGGMQETQEARSAGAVDGSCHSALL